jgi:hypothetical protein
MEKSAILLRRTLKKHIQQSVEISMKMEPLKRSSVDLKNLAASLLIPIMLSAVSIVHNYNAEDDGFYVFSRRKEKWSIKW